MTSTENPPSLELSHPQTLVAAQDLPNLIQHARTACLRVPALWPLHSFVAVNPFVGLVGRPFSEVCGLIQRITHESMLPGVEYFREQFANGRITMQHIAASIEQSKAPTTPEELLSWLMKPHKRLNSPNGVHSVAEIATSDFGGRCCTLVTEEISKWCAAYFDEGQSAWRMPWRKLPLFAAWKKAASLDATPELLGLKGFRKLVSGLPDSTTEAVSEILCNLGVSASHTENYLHRLLMTLPGWSSYVQYRVRDKAMHGTHDESLLDLLAIRLAFELQIMRQFESAGIRDRWQATFTSESNDDCTVQNLLLWHSALEVGFQRELCNSILNNGNRKTVAGKNQKIRPALQAIFCIDVRSEVMRRSLEASSRNIETLGFAGFFGMPIEYIPFGQRHGTSQLPVFFSPKYRVREYLPQATPAQEKLVRRNLQTGRRISHSWNAFKTSAVSCFSFVEAAGVGFAWRLMKDGFQIGGSNRTHNCSGCAAPNLHEHKRLTPDPLDDTQPEAGIPPEDQVQLALGALKNMGLTSDIARLVMLCGHGSNTTNNPYAAGLDCGACGGHAGDSNARVAAAILNQSHVRTALTEHGMHIPHDTYFVAALHDTTTDVITLFDIDKVPSSHNADLFQLQLWLDEAGNRCRNQRSLSLGIPSAGDAELKSLICQRSLDWSQVRPEWGLAGNAAFIVAPRERTYHLNLKGRVFLHNYIHAADTTKSSLELIMTAPMIVTNWINLQYYASTVNNQLWGSGNKVTHNVMGTIGIQQGNGGDLQAGLPLQSVHNGETWMHEPMRLSVFIEAPRTDIDDVIAKHESVRQLVENGWLHLFAIEDEGRLIVRRRYDGLWDRV